LSENNKTPDDRLVEGTLPPGCAAALVYTTFPGRDAAIAAGRALVEGRHAGCINILDAMTSVYVWNGETVVGDEVVLIAKVPTDSVMGCIAELKRLHPYETPAILVLPVAVADASYLNWLRGGTNRNG
jgi:periplasmic divalent cation tolerance protein